MVEIMGDPPQAAGWTDAIEGRDVDWDEIFDGYDATVDWPGASFWREISAANPDALVLLSTRDPEAWYRSASNTIFNPVEATPPGLEEWFGVTVPNLFGTRFSADLGNPPAMIEAFERHTDEVRARAPPDPPLQRTAPADWEPLSQRLSVPQP